MSLENEYLGIVDELDASSKKLTRSYTRQFLLSLRDLDVCKKLPSDFDESVLCEFEDSKQSYQDRQKVPGNRQFQCFRRNEYGSSPPSRGDSAIYSRGNYGKMGNRPSDQSDRDSDSQSDLDSESGRLFSQQSRRSWHATEQDGLLGSGTLPRLSGCTSGVSAPRMKTFEQNQLRKSNGPYHPPPRTYKALPYSRRDTDAYNDETFGSKECSNENRVEEERRRRASFEQMRKEQQMTLQEKHISITKANDIFVEDKKEEIQPSTKKDESQVSLAIPTVNNPSDKSLASSPSYRPLIPPGFRNNILEKGSGSKSPANHALLEEGQNLAEESIFGSVGLEHSRGKKSSDAEENQLSRGSSEAVEEPDNFEVNPHVSTEKAVSNTNKDNSSSSVLGKMIGGHSGLTSSKESKAEDEQSPSSVRPSSKFAQWFSEEEPKSRNNILSLLVSGDKNRYRVSDSETAEGSSEDLLSKNSEPSRKPATTIHSNPTTILTCEDLENSILTECSGQTTAMSLPVLGAGNAEEKMGGYVDGNASLHLLSLLHRGGATDQNKDNDGGPSFNIPFANKQRPPPVVSMDGESIVNSEKSLTLEMLFGSAFVKELQSVQAPVSVQRGLSEAVHGMPFPVAENISSSSSGFNYHQRPINDQILHDVKNREEEKQRGLGFIMKSSHHLDEFSAGAAVNNNLLMGKHHGHVRPDYMGVREMAFTSDHTPGNNMMFHRPFHDPTAAIFNRQMAGNYPGMVMMPPDMRLIGGGGAHKFPNPGGYRPTSVDSYRPEEGFQRANSSDHRNYPFVASSGQVEDMALRYR